MKKGETWEVKESGRKVEIIKIGVILDSVWFKNLNEDSLEDLCMLSRKAFLKFYKKSL